MYITVEVTQKDINKSRKRLNDAGASRSMNCPISLGITKYLKPNNWASTGFTVTTIHIVTKSGETYKEYNLPEHVSTFIDKFDEGKKVKPISFRLNILKELLKGQ